METTKEIYEKYKKISKGMPVGVIWYWNFFDNVLEPQTLNISFRNETKTLNIMKTIEHSEHFKFWAISQEGEEFFKINKVALGQAFYNAFEPMTKTPMN